MPGINFLGGRLEFTLDTIMAPEGVTVASVPIAEVSSNFPVIGCVGKKKVCQGSDVESTGE